MFNQLLDHMIQSDAVAESLNIWRERPSIPSTFMLEYVIIANYMRRCRPSR